MNAHTVGRHVELQPRANSFQTPRPSLALSLSTNLVTDLFLSLEALRRSYRAREAENRHRIRKWLLGYVKQFQRRSVQPSFWRMNLPKREKVTRASAINSVTKITSRYTTRRMYGSPRLGTSAQLASNLPRSKS